MRSIAGTLLLILSRAAAQTPDASPQFEVASIKPAPPPNGRGMRVSSRGGPGTPDPGLFTCENWAISDLVMRAYDLQDYQLSAPDWIQSARFSISAKVPMGTTKEQFQLMLQNLLVERFKLTFHHEKKEMRAYDLLVAKNGPKIKQSMPATLPQDDDPPTPRPAGPPKKDENGFPILPPGREPIMWVIGGGHATQRFVEESMDHFIELLAGQLRSPVTDATGLKGKYDFTMNWIMDGGGPSTDDTGPNLFAALQQQLGLKLASKKCIVDILVVDHIEKTPTEN